MDSIPQKQCPKCNQTKPATAKYFQRNKSRYDGWQGYCKDCLRRPKADPAPPEGHKRCFKCKEVFPATVEHFYAQKRGTHGLHSWCKPCFLAEEKERYVKKPKISTAPEGYKRCSQCGEVKPHDTEHFYRNGANHLYSMCKPCRKVYAAKVVTPEKRLAYSRHYEAIPEYKARRKDYRESPKGRDNRKINGASRRARKKKVAGKFTSQQILEQYKRQKGKCYYCNNKVKWGEHHVDHTFPLSRVAGTDIPANDINYLVIACPTCNMKKNDKFPWEWPEGGRLL